MKKAFFILLLTLYSLAAFAQAKFQPLIALKPDKTVFLYAADVNKALEEIDDPVVSGSVETLGLTPAEECGITEPEKMVGDLGQICNINGTARFDLYFPEKPNGQMVVMCPGGGYQVVCTYGEGLYAAEWLLGRGITVAVVKHRMPNGHWTVPLADVQEVFRYCRAHASEWEVSRIGVMGYSAGGHLAASASTLYVDAATRPDFSILFYPVISFVLDNAEEGTRDHLIGTPAYWADRSSFTADEYLDRCLLHEHLLEYYSLENRVDANTPPAFIVHGQNDRTVPVSNSIAYYSKLLQNGIKSELHIWDNAPHGFCFFPSGAPDLLDAGIRQSLNGSLERWLNQID